MKNVTKRVLATALIAVLALSGTLSYNVNSVAAIAKSSTKMETNATKISEKAELCKKKVSLDKSKKFKQKNMVSPQSSVNSITQVFDNIFLSEQDDYIYLPLTLKAGDIVQATLEGPNSAEIDYDLLLYTLNDGQLGTLVAECGLTTHINNSTGKSVEDAISYINNSSGNQDYALFVYATTGYSTTDGAKLTVSIDENGFYDKYEPNDNPFNAVSVTDDASVTGCNLNVSNDQDWYVWKVSSGASKATISLSNSNYKYEVYTASGRSMVLKEKNYFVGNNFVSGGYYNLSAGYYYVRVFNNKDTFESSDYTLKFAKHKPAKIEISDFSSDTSPNKVNYGSGSFYRFKYGFTVTIKVTDASGNPVPNEEVYCLWKSGSWVEGSVNHERSTTQITDSKGEIKFTVSDTPAVGSYSWTDDGPIVIRHYYDIDALGYSCGGFSKAENMYHLAYSMYVSS